MHAKAPHFGLAAGLLLKAANMHVGPCMWCSNKAPGRHGRTCRPVSRSTTRAAWAADASVTYLQQQQSGQAWLCRAHCDEDTARTNAAATFKHTSAKEYCLQISAAVAVAGRRYVAPHAMSPRASPLSHRATTTASQGREGRQGVRRWTVLHTCGWNCSCGAAKILAAAQCTGQLRMSA